MPPSRVSRLSVVLLLVLVLIGLSLRLLGLAYGLPATYNPDETPILNRALALAKGDPSPHNFLYPSLYFYMLFAWEALFFVAGRLVGLYDSLAAFQRDYFVDPSRHFLAGRALTALCGTLTIPALYWFGRRLYDNATGLAAAAFLAVSPIAVRDAHYVKLDVPTTMFNVLAHAALARVVMDPEAAGRRRPWLIAGFLSGLAVSTQYYAVFVGFSMLAAAIAVAHRTRDWRSTGAMFLWSTLAAVAGFLAGTPFLPFELQTAITDVAHVREVDIDRATAGGALFTGTLPYLRMLITDAAGWPVAIAGLAGLIWAFATDWRRALLLVSFFVPFFLFIANTVPMSRYLNIVVPIVALWGGVGVIAVSRSISASPAVATALVTVAMIPGLISSLRTDLFIRQADTRTLAQDFIEANVPEGKTFLVQPYSAPIRRTRDSLIESLRANLGHESRASVKFQLTMALDPYPSPAYRLIYLGDGGLDTDKIYVSPQAFANHGDLSPLRALGVEYVVLKQANVPNPVMAPLESALRREGRRLAEFTPYRANVGPEARRAVPPFLHNTSSEILPELARPGPTMEIWAIAPLAKTEPASPKPLAKAVVEAQR